MLNCIYDKFQGGYENGYVLSDGETLMTVQHLAIETHTQVTVCFKCEDGATREFLISHQGILEFDEPISFYGMYFKTPTEALITYTT